MTLCRKERTALDQRGTGSAEAYDLYLRARALWSAGNASNHRSNEAIQRLCGEATARDPAYAGAWALMALAGAELRFWQGVAVDALAPAEKAIALDGRLAEPHCVRARQLEELGHDEDAEAAVELALQLDPEFMGGQPRGGTAALPPRGVAPIDPVFRKSRRRDEDRP